LHCYAGSGSETGLLTTRFSSESLLSFSRQCLYLHCDL